MEELTWIILDPVDTLFFRGAESMEAGEHHEVDTMFPPMPQTIAGAIRSAVLVQRAIAPREYLAAPDQHPFLGQPESPGFSLVGPLFLVRGESLLLPAPASWFADLPESGDGMITVQAAAPLKNTSPGLAGSVAAPFWVRNPAGDDLKSLSGYWATVETFRQVRGGTSEVPLLADTGAIEPGRAVVVAPSALFDREERLGIALTEARTARDGHLYTSVHIRLRPGVEIAAGIVTGHDIPLDDSGIIQLGGEQRLCRYRLRRDLALPDNGNGNTVAALSPVAMDELPEPLQNCPRASGKILRIGGWDMKKRFHKPMRAWLPAGSVFCPKDDFRDDNKNFIAI